ncbi:MAG: transposase, partial [Phototrophicales bacterium]
TGQITPAKGQASFYNPIQVTEKTYGPVHLAVANPMHRNETWMGLSNRPVSEETFGEYGYRFDIEETFLDDKSNGFQLESSQLRSAAA